MRVSVLIILIFIFSFGCGKKTDNSNLTEAEDSLEIKNNYEEVFEETDTEIVENNQEKTEKVKISKESDKKNFPQKKLEQNYTTKANLWRSYRAAKSAVKKAKAKNDYRNQVRYLLEAAKFAEALDRADIEAWQYNNAGYALIEVFKKSTNYYYEMNVLNSLKYKSEIDLARKDIRAEMSSENSLLLEANRYLVKAKDVDARLDESPRTTTIASNIKFIMDVTTFLE